ncbi:MAG TPA: 4Fe-4S dicluster domain-containing protein [Candidatus Desulfovibrio intestinipullorum]|uniref:4Fe-4S dicluster domain-containing protein n=1 Tax=Candidatus Desulfovibrio intestinipullorum TaxID=2838536 RepID=A0A9D1PXK0_9BACT|nr:4Fe-4S dicluster domain-containing protein [Candidatus Desulfovibrio intestinipullorum]
MSTYRFAKSSDLPALLAFFAKENRVLVPVVKQAVKPSVVFAPWKEGMDFTLDKPTVPAKEAVLPPSETLVTYEKTRNPDEPDKFLLHLDDTPEATPTVVFGCRACDARGYATLDRPFLNGLYKDPYYAARRNSLTVVTLTCNSGCNTCFCHWVGGGPSSPEGSDILMTELGDGYVLQAVTEKGKAVLEASPLADGQDREKEVMETRKAAWATLSKKPDLSLAPDRVLARFTDTDFWKKETERCLSCGACTYFCPSCYCFNITDEGSGMGKPGRRIRSWDNCMSSLFTREASGHNPRAAKAERMRQRVTHKFATYPENWGAFSCMGCGRCISNCPARIDIRQIVLDAVALGEKE